MSYDGAQESKCNRRTRRRPRGPALIVSPTAAADAPPHLVGPGARPTPSRFRPARARSASSPRSPGRHCRGQQPGAVHAGRGAVGRLNPHVNLVNTLNGGQFTVFAPTNDAFAKLDPATVEKLKTDSTLLSLDPDLPRGLRPGRSRPGGRHPQDRQRRQRHGQGMGDHLMVNDANVVCGGIPTTNATIYLIDTVLLPPAN